MTDYSQRLLDLMEDLAEHEDDRVKELVGLTAALVKEYTAVVVLQRDAERAYARIRLALDPASARLLR